jgi:hypothetical protein
MLHTFSGVTDDGHCYTRTWVSCDGPCCHVEGEPVVSAGDGAPADAVQAMYGAGFTVVGDRALCQLCRAGAVGAA